MYRSFTSKDRIFPRWTATVAPIPPRQFALLHPSRSPTDGRMRPTESWHGHAVTHFIESVGYIAVSSNRGVQSPSATPTPLLNKLHALSMREPAFDPSGNGIAQEIRDTATLSGRQLAEDRLTATFIADGHHLPQDVLKVMLRAKGVERSRAGCQTLLPCSAGMPPGTYLTPVGGRFELHPEGGSRFGRSFLQVPRLRWRDVLATWCER